MVWVVNAFRCLWRVDFLADVRDCRSVIPGRSFGIARWIKEGFVLGESIRVSAEAWVCR
jgi:hypothetical protein